MTDKRVLRALRERDKVEGALARYANHCVLFSCFCLALVIVAPGWNGFHCFNILKVHPKEMYFLTYAFTVFTYVFGCLWVFSLFVFSMQLLHSVNIHAGKI